MAKEGKLMPLMAWLARAWTFFWRPSSRVSLGALLIAGGIGGVIFWGGFNWAMESTNTADDRLKGLLSRPLPDDAEHREALDLILSHDGLARARQVARDWSDDARAAIVGLPEGPVKAAMNTLCDYVVDRTA